MLGYRAIVLDLDGTFLGKDKKVSARNLAAVLACYEKGMRIIIATARPPRSVNVILPEELLSIGSFVYYNGAQAVCQTSLTEFHYVIPASLTGEIIDYCIQEYPDLALSLEVKGEWFSLGDHDYMTTMHVEANPLGKTVEELKQLDATKILLSGAFKGKPLFDRYGGKVAIVYTDRNSLVQVMAQGVSKEQAVLRLCGVYGFEVDEVLVFGDDHNDIGLFRIGAHAVAMGNAIPELKELASEVTSAHDEDGVALILERVLLGEEKRRQSLLCE